MGALARVGDRYTKRKAGAVLTIEMTAGSMLTLRERLSGDNVLAQREREMLRYLGWRWPGCAERARSCSEKRTCLREVGWITDNPLDGRRRRQHRDHGRRVAPAIHDLADRRDPRLLP